MLFYVLTLAAFLAGVLAGALGLNRILWILRIGYPLTRELTLTGELKEPRAITRPFPLSIVSWAGVVALLSIWFVRETLPIYALFYFFGLIFTAAIGFFTTRVSADTRRRFLQSYRSHITSVTPHPEATPPPREQNS
jgi:hypothetical protein